MPGYVWQPLSADHIIGDFDCGNDEANYYLLNEALRDQEICHAATHVAVDTGKPANSTIAGFCALRADSITFTDADEVGREVTVQIPAIELMWIARDLRWKGQLVGPYLMTSALLTVHGLTEQIGAAGIHLRATPAGERLAEQFEFRRLDRQHGFGRSLSSDRHRYFLSITDIQHLLRRWGLL